MRVTSSSASVHSQQRIRHTLRTLHLWLGLSVGLIFAIVALCGTILTFQNDLLLLRYPQLANHALPDAAQRAAVLETIYKTKWPAPLMSAEAPDEKLPVWQVYLGGDMRAYVDPATGAQLLTRSAQNDWMLFIRKLHTHLLSGEVGEQGGEALGDRAGGSWVAVADADAVADGPAVDAQDRDQAAHGAGDEDLVAGGGHPRTDVGGVLGIGRSAERARAKSTTIERIALAE